MNNIKTIEVPAELYTRLGKLASNFETPAELIEKLINAYELRNSPEFSNLEIIYLLNDSEEEFKIKFLERDVAYIKIFYTDGSKEEKVWHKRTFSKESSVQGNLRTGVLRGWKKKGICKAIVSTDLDDIRNYSN